MANPIQAQELMDLAQLRTEIVQTREVYSQFKDAVEAQNKSIAQSLSLVVAELEAVKTKGVARNKYTETEIALGSQLIAQVQQLRASDKALNSIKEQSGAVVEALTARLGKLIEQYKAETGETAKSVQAKKRLAAEMVSVTKQTDALNKGLKLNESGIKEVTGQYNILQKELADARRELHLLDNSFDKQSGKLNRANREAVALSEKIRLAHTALGNFDKEIAFQYTRNIDKYGSALNKGFDFASVIGKLSLAGIALSKLTEYGEATVRAIGEIGTKYEKLDALLSTVFVGNVAAITKARAVIKDFAADSPSVGIDGITSAFTRLVGIGINPTKEELINLSDIAISKNKQITDYVEAIADAQTGEFERLKEFSIRASKDGDKVTFTYAGVSKTVDNTAQSITKYLIELGKLPGIVGATNNLQQTSAGKSAQMGSSFRDVANILFKIFQPAVNGSIDLLTRFAKFIAGGFKTALDVSSEALNRQTADLNNLESKIPGLLSRYDDLKSKAKLSADEQKDLQSIINQLVNLVPSAATGFDLYGNALDVNKGKVLSFAAAQRQLNAELNKQVVSDLNKQIEGNLQQSQSLQNSLNKGTKRQRFNFTPFILRNNQERATATERDPAKRDQVPLTSADTRDLQQKLQSTNQQIEAGFIQLLSVGGKLTKEQERYIDRSGNSALKQYKLLQDYNSKIAELKTKQADLYIAGDKESLRNREAVLKELKEYEDKKREILSPSAPSTLPNSKSTAQITKEQAKAQSEANKRLNQELAKSAADTEKRLSKAEADRQDGLLSEQDYIEKRLSITLAGVERQRSLLDRAGKTDTDEYKKVLTDKLDAETQYNRDQLKLDIALAKDRTSTELANLEKRKNEGAISETEYVNEKHAIAEKGLNQQLRIIEEAGQKESELFRKTNRDLLAEQADYTEERVKVERRAWKEQLNEVKQGLAAIDQELGGDLAAKLADIENTYTKKRQDLELSIKRGNTDPEAGRLRVHELYLEQLREETAALEASYAKDRQLSNALIADKISLLEAYKLEAIRTPAEIEAAENAIRELQRARDKDEAEDKKKLNKEVADNAKKNNDETFKNESDNIDKAKAKREIILQKAFELTQYIGDAISAGTTNRLSKELRLLEVSKERELKLVGDNAEARDIIEEKYNKRKAAIQRKQAIADRNAALFNIALSTAQGVMSVLSTGGGTRYADLGISAGLLSAFVIATGLAQAAAVLTRDIPEFWKGKKDGYEGLGYVGDRGPELVERVNPKTGKRTMQLAAENQLTYLSRHDKVYTATETRRILSERQEAITGLERTSPSNMVGDRIAAKLSVQTDQKGLTGAFKDAIKDIPVQENIWDDRGYNRAVRERTRRVQDQNNRYSLPRKNR